MGASLNVFGKMKRCSENSEIIISPTEERVFCSDENIVRPTDERMFCSDENNGYIFQNKFLPEEVVSNVLSYLDCKSLLLSRRVCQSWKNIIDTTAFKLKVKRSYAKSLENLSQSSVSKLPWFVFYAICKKVPFNQNLILNGCGQDHYRYWKMQLKGGDGWFVENPPHGCDPLPEHITEFESYNICFATSYAECKKQQTIDLKEHGFTDKIMDEIQPDIEISEWFAGRFDCGCYYELLVTLLNEKEEPLPNFTFHHEETIKQWEGRAWKKVSYVFSNYGPGVRYVLFIHRGNDTQYWKGHYGSKMSGAKVLLKLPEHGVHSRNSSISSESDDVN